MRSAISCHALKMTASMTYVTHRKHHQRQGGDRAHSRGVHKLMYEQKEKGFLKTALVSPKLETQTDAQWRVQFIEAPRGILRRLILSKLMHNVTIGV